MTTENDNPPKPVETPAEKPEADKAAPVENKEPTATKGALQCVVEDVASIKKHLGLDVKKSEEPKPPPANVPEPKSISRSDLLIDKYVDGLTGWMF